MIDCQKTLNRTKTVFNLPFSPHVKKRIHRTRYSNTIVPTDRSQYYETYKLHHIALNYYNFFLLELVHHEQNTITVSDVLPQ